MPKPPLRLGVIEPVDAVRNFDERQLLLPSFRWQDVWQHEHQRGFAVAGVMREDVLAIFRTALDEDLAAGGSLADFRKRVRPLLAEKGFWGDVEVADPTTGETRVTRFDNRRLELIYDVNVRQSYAAGKWQRYQATKDHLPYGRYITMGDAYVRPAHRAWHNVVLPLDHPWWKTHWPPNGWRCRCRVMQLGQRDVDRMIADGQHPKLEAPPDDMLPYVNPWTGEVKAVPRGVDPGFGYNPGVRDEGGDAALAETTLQKVVRSDAFSGAVIAAQAAADMPALLARRAAAFGAWLEAAAAQPTPTGQAFTLGTLRPEVVRALESTGQPLQGAAITVTDFDAAAAIAPGEGGAAAAAGADAAIQLYRQLPVLLARPVAVLRLVASGRLVYVIEVAGADGKAARLYVEIEPAAGTRVAVDAQSVRRNLNLVRSASLQAPEQLGRPTGYTLVWGVWP